MSGSRDTRPVSFLPCGSERDAKGAVEDGGTASTLADLGEDRIFFGEYVSKPDAFTLNG